ncbi:efflux transporter outer membrane subunit [Sphingomonas sp. AOB5]|uniref:efflux transporter outer membrane subunit n=1 Tax=Sphingomonas sp. AOB5 TaxID=3034017 RepID=UPI0023F76874|nr:efflux transporter outer membrane subunit [Sphingomonas sp. AOB5]MDF7775848.1 efflux transporter outer membrane subunit [Sphingomonas sp. AOB5]
MIKRPITLLLVAALPLSACATGPDYRPKSATELGVPDAWSVAANQQNPEDLGRWWAKFDDPMLGQLVEQGRTANLDVAVAVTRLRQARESLVQSRASLLPTISGSAGYSRNVNVAGQNFSGANDSFSIGADASYQLDLFGGVSRGIEASGAAFDAAKFDYASVLISVQGEIARNYVLARLAQQQLANARDSLAIQDDNLEIAGFRVQAGLVSSLDGEQARASRAQTAATIPSIEASYNGFVSRLGVLTGQAPGALKAQMETVRPIPAGPASIAVGIPADTLRQRPDVRSAERNLAAATARIGVAEAQLYPALSIGGSLNSGGGALSTLFDAISGRLFASLAQTIFDGGRLRSQVRSNEAAAEGAFLTYKQTILTGLEDVENAIVALNAAQQRAEQFAIAYEAANNSAILSRMQYRSGLTDFTTLNTAESQLLSARNGLAQARADQATALIQLYLALGGGWDISSIPETGGTNG